MPRRTKEKALETERRILDVSLKIFLQKNFADVSVADIASGLGMTKGAVYWHFSNKSEIMETLIKNMCSNIENSGTSLPLPDADALSFYRRYCAHSLSRGTDEEPLSNLHRLVLKMNEWPPELRRKVKQHLLKAIGRQRKTFETAIDKGQKEGRVRTDISKEDVSEVLSAVASGLFSMYMNGILPTDFMNKADFLFSAIEESFSSGTAHIEK